MSADPAPRRAFALALGASGGVLLGVACSMAPAPGDAVLPEDPGAPASDPPSCAASGAAARGRTGEALSVVDRSLVGDPVDYAADGALRGSEAALNHSTRTRRELGWNVAARVVGPVTLSGSLGASSASLPAWQTWHNKDDLTRIFRRVYPELSPEERASRAPFDAGGLDESWSWNDDATGDFEAWTLERLTAYQQALDTSAKLAGVGGVYRVAYSPAASRYILGSYGELLDCRASDARVEEAPSGAPADL